ncbi:hypothetical protein U9M48_026815 [Paspalum notatum var. saurae]|uniref:SAM domain-containing protein n=1 Tax=Paspalum notatum var. saurae TaxID=547442 RepID=A0AAQ3TVA7_PASNO
MDWYAWLSRTGLAPSLTHEYGRLFSRNELEPGDAPHFDHDLLKSMGIAVAKHRLEILKLAKKQKPEGEGEGEGSSSAASRLARRATRCVARCVRRLADGGGGGGRRASGASSSVSVVPRICSGDDAVRVGAVQRKSAAPAGANATTAKKMVLMITDGGDGLLRAGGARLSASSQKASLMFHGCYPNDDDGDEEEEMSEVGEEGRDGDIKWDSMFQDLKPT